ncbi:MAG: UDP-N-acetylmuramoyl-tripeptide--D-alanyl-D-alanine ligase [Clostridia bacterium]|nr:UDP-N-acetylmuramoyl-tripeptide--D-alanyl-D-alanine ligase [Clostridia bacterium]
MKELKIKEIVEVVDGKLVIGNLDFICGDFCKDTRIIKEGDTYIGIKGENFDGNMLWEQAFEKGAKTIIVQGVDFLKNDLEKFKDRNVIVVKDTIKAISDIARYKRELFGKDFPTVGVTGSVGKTSTKDIIANVVSQKYKTLKTEGNNNNEIGLPFTLFRLDDHEAAVIEMGMNHFDEISRLTRVAEPTVSVITNIGTSHIGNLGSRENILKAKLEILDGMEKKVLVINNDNDLLHDLYLKNNDIEIHTYGIENQSEVMAEDVVLNENDSEFVCNLNGCKFKVKVPVGGIHFVYNSLCAAVVGNLLGLSVDEIRKGIETFELTKKRMDITELKNGVTIINDSYNASFESMQASLKYLGALKKDRKIAVLGDMFELGEYSKELHEKVGEEVAKNGINVLICAGENAKNIVDSAKKSGMSESDIYYFEDKSEIEEFIKKNWRKGDSILFKASNGMRFFEIAESLLKI